jgi:hypothetical protein
LTDWTPHRDTAIVPKFFTPESANRTLPLVRRIVEDIVVQFARWQAKVREFELVSASNSVASPDPQAVELEHEVAALAADLEHFQRELASLGVAFKDYVQGLVDFPAEREGRPVYLCWRLGEPAVEFWHEIDAGYAGRQPLEPRVAA